MTDKFCNWEEQKNSFRLETKEIFARVVQSRVEILISNLNSVLNVYKSKFLEILTVYTI